MNLVRRDDADGVATITLNRPEKLNALTPPMFVELRQHIDDIADDMSVHCVILTGAGRSFCAGNDLESLAAGQTYLTPHFASETVDALEQLPHPTIAKVRGHCLTGGLELALGCDLIVAGRSATLGDTHAQWGIVPVWGMSVRLPERVGSSTAKELMFTSRRVDAVEARTIGLVDRIVDDDQLDSAATELAALIAANSPGTNRIVKRLVADRHGMTREAALLHERERPYGRPEDMAERMTRRRRS